MKNTHQESSNVLYSSLQIPRLTHEDMLDLMKLAKTQTENDTIRLCLHPNKNSKLHEMIIVHHSKAIVPIHRHTDKDESIIIYEGEMEIVFFDNNGKIQEKYLCGNYNSNKIYHIRIPSMQWHTMKILTEQVCFCEATTGPFDPSAMEKSTF